jgi:hypothetical protein
MFPTTGTPVEMFPHTDGILDMFPHTGDIHNGVSGHVETVVCLSNKNARSKDYVEIGLDVEDYYRIKDSAGADKCGGAEEDE